MKRRRTHVSRLLIHLGFWMLFMTGIAVLLWPFISNQIAARAQRALIDDYDESLSALDDEALSDEIAAARTYNEELSAGQSNYLLAREVQTLIDKVAEGGHGIRSSTEFITDDPTLQKEYLRYRSLLRSAGSDIMGSLQIPRLAVALPIYHGTSEAQLQVGVGHMPGSSLPVGGPSTHCVLAGHSGLPSAELFSRLGELGEGDQFFLKVFEETLWYEVDQILVVTPDRVEPLAIVEGRDLCTLITCTPYGINSHRLLVRAHRIAEPRSWAGPGVSSTDEWLGAALAMGAAALVMGIEIVTVRHRMRQRAKV